VFGVEADIQGTGMRDSYTCLLTCTLPGAGGVASQFNQKLDWFGTVRGRATGPVLTYVTASRAYGNVKTTLTETGGYAYGRVRTKIMADGGSGPVTADLSQTKGGWTVGGGIETPLTFMVSVLGTNWASKTGYLYVDLGNSTGTFTVPAAVGSPVVATSSTQVREHIFRTGLSYHFQRIAGDREY
jgi:outer membrane immunogenic protein